MKSSKGKDSDNTLSGDTILGADMESEVRASGSLREGSNTQVEFRLHYSVDEIKRLAQEIHDETVNDGLMALFTGWVCDDFENYELAKQYIRELGIDDTYDTLRIKNDKLRKLVEAVAHFRPQYRCPLNQNRPEMVTLLQILQESAVAQEDSIVAQESAVTPQKEPQSSSFRSPFASLRSKSSFFRTRTSNLKQESPMRGPSRLPEVKSRVRQDYTGSPMRSPVPAPVTPREASPHVGSLRAVSKKVSPSVNIAETKRTRSQQYPPDTPDRPLPLVIKSRSTPSSNLAVKRSVSTPTRTYSASPLSAQDSSPIPPMPPYPPPARHLPPIPSPAGPSALRRSKYVLFPPQNPRKPRKIKTGDPFTSEGDKDASRSSSDNDVPLKSTDGITAGEHTEGPESLSESTCALVESNAVVPKQHNGNVVVESRHDTPVTGTEARLSSATSSDTSIYDEFGFLKSDSREEGELLAVDSAPSMPARSRTTNTRWVTSAQRAAAQEASKEAIRANLAAMQFHERDDEGEDDDEDAWSAAAEEGERLVLEFGVEKD